MTIASDIQLLSPTALVELFILDIGKYGGGLLYFHAGTNELNGNVTWQGQVYTRYPIEATGFSKRSGSTLPRPILKASNVGGTLAAQARAYSDFLGCKVTRKRTLVRYLDAVNFAAGNPTADVNQAFPDDVYFVDRKSGENPISIEFELAAAFDIQGVVLPRRQVIQNTCAWVYRSAECGYTGGAVAKADGTATAVLAEDKCSKRLLDGCKLRFPDPAPMPFGGMPGTGLIH
jgi:lambda family phage minor tail protein L